MQIRVVIVGTVRVHREGLAALLRARIRILVVGIRETASEVLACAAAVIFAIRPIEMRRLTAWMGCV